MIFLNVLKYLYDLKHILIKDFRFITQTIINLIQIELLKFFINQVFQSALMVFYHQSLINYLKFHFMKYTVFYLQL